MLYDLYLKGAASIIEPKTGENLFAETFCIHIVHKVSQNHSKKQREQQTKGSEHSEPPVIGIRARIRSTTSSSACLLTCRFAQQTIKTTPTACSMDCRFIAVE